MIIFVDVCSVLIEVMASCRANEERLKVLEEAKLPYLFSSEQLLKMLEITTSIKTKIAMIAQIGPRLVDPKAKTQQFLDIFRYADEKNQVEEILKARSQAIVSSQFSTASTAGRGGGGRGGLLAGRGGGGRGGAGRGAGLGAATAPVATRPMPSVPASTEQPTEVAPQPTVVSTPGKKHLEVNTSEAATTPMNHPFSPGSTVSTPGNEPVVSDIHDVFSFLDSAVSPGSARPSSRRITMDTISERVDEVDEEDSEEDEDEDNGKSSQHALADDTSLTTTETAPSVSTMTSSPYVRSQLPTTGSMVHNLSDGSLTETDSKAADAAVALIAAIVAKEGVAPVAPAVPIKEVETPKTSAPTEPTPVVVAEVTKKTEAVAAAVVEDQGPVGGLLLRPVSRSNSIQLDDDNDGPKSTGSLDLSARPRSFSNPNSANAASNTVLNTSSGDGYSNAPRDRNSLLKQSLHHSSFTVGHVQSKDEELQAVANATSQIRQMAAKIFSGGDKESAIAVVTGPTAPGRALQRTHSEVISKELSRSTGSIQYQPAAMKPAAPINVSKSSGGAGDDLVIRYASQAKLSKEAFLSLAPADPIGKDANGEDVYSYHELLRRNFRKDYGELKQTELQRYLADAEFAAVFGKTKQEFDAQAKWRQVDQKKKALLF